MRQVVDDIRLLALAVELMTNGPTEALAVAWSLALADLADESGDDLESAGPAGAFDEAREYLTGLCAGLGVDLPELTTDIGLAGEALAEVLRHSYDAPEKEAD